MKLRNILPVTLSGLLLLSLFSCRQAPKESTYSLLERDESIHLTDDSLSPVNSIHISLPYVVSSADDSVAVRINEQVVTQVFGMEHLTPEEAVDSFIAQRSRTYRKDLLPYYEEDCKTGKNALGWYSYYYELGGSTESGVEGVVNFLLTVNSYEGGAHGNQNNIYLNFQLSDGHLMTLDELFIEDYRRPLSAILLDKLMEKLNVNSLEELQEQGFLSWTDMYPSDNFLLKEDKIVFLYNPYEIAPYSAGVTLLEIPYNELTDLLKNE